MLVIEFFILNGVFKSNACYRIFYVEKNCYRQLSYAKRLLSIDFPCKKFVIDSLAMQKKFVIDTFFINKTCYPQLVIDIENLVSTCSLYDKCLINGVFT